MRDLGSNNLHETPPFWFITGNEQTRLVRHVRFRLQNIAGSKTAGLALPPG
eukprot:SAG11_NODE_38715_length_251_cov_0.677632_1_plen_50_part_10